MARIGLGREQRWGRREQAWAQWRENRHPGCQGGRDSSLPAQHSSKFHSLSLLLHFSPSLVPTFFILKIYTQASRRTSLAWELIKKQGWSTKLSLVSQLLYWDLSWPGHLSGAGRHSAGEQLRHTCLLCSAMCFSLSYMLSMGRQTHSHWPSSSGDIDNILLRLQDWVCLKMNNTE